MVDQLQRLHDRDCHLHTLIGKIDARITKEFNRGTIHSHRVARRYMGLMDRVKFARQANDTEMRRCRFNL